MARILIVDDNALNRELLCAFLEGDEHELLEADSGEQALTVAEAKSPDLVILDVMMPGMDGFQVTRRLKMLSAPSFLPVILATSLADKQSRIRGLEAGADDFLTKPVDRTELAIRIRNLLTLREKDSALVKRAAELIAEARQRQEMADLIIHDLKNPMAVVISNLGFLGRAIPEGNLDAQGALTDASDAGRRVLRLLENLLDLTRAENGGMELRTTATALRPLLEQTVGPRERIAADRGQALALDVPGDLEASIDADLVVRAVENLLDNALRHTPDGGRIRVRARRDSAVVELRIGNSGRPIPVPLRTAIFEKFAQAGGASRHNFGLGLYFCRMVAAAHGGQIWVEESSELATDFVLRLRS